MNRFKRLLGNTVKYVLFAVLGVICIMVAIAFFGALFTDPARLIFFGLITLWILNTINAPRRRREQQEALEKGITKKVMRKVRSQQLASRPRDRF